MNNCTLDSVICLKICIKETSCPCTKMTRKKISYLHVIYTFTPMVYFPYANLNENTAILYILLQIRFSTRGSPSLWIL